LIAAIALASSIMAQEPFNGRITGADGKGIRARIRVENSDKYTSSDGKGRFGLTDIKADDILLIIYKRDTLRIAIEGRQSIDIVVATDSKRYEARESEELASYGFGYVKRRESTDYSSGISGDRLRATGAKGVIEAIQMCYPGLRYINGELCLLTQNSIGSSSAVLVLCDGMETRPELINLYDVKSVEIIKGSNMYGFRGVNGVVLITTMSAEDVLKRER
ncbi:MAG: TonB-dependent receptor plug domain-containing protein, partial [Alistipes sp.]|nr:TonB-dependent receptor plug domain-containing protein [Alistipes sp.]